MKKSSLPALPCACASLRRAARTVSALYEEALRPADLTISQFTLLQTLTLAGEVTQGRLGEILGMDSTTLTRTLKILERQSWLTRHRGEDRREWRFQLSKKGAAKFKSALPLWQHAQTQLRNRLGEDRWKAIAAWTDHLTSTAL